MARRSKNATKKVTIAIGFDTADARSDLSNLDRQTGQMGRKAGKSFADSFGGLAQGVLGAVTATTAAAAGLLRAGDPGLLELSWQRTQQAARGLLEGAGVSSNADNAEIAARGIVADHEGSRRAAGFEPRSRADLQMAIERLSTVIERSIEGRRSVEDTLTTRERSAFDAGGSFLQRNLSQGQQMWIMQWAMRQRGTE